MSRNTTIILALVLAVYALLSLYRPGGLMAYALPSACWGLLTLATLKLGGFRKIKSWFNKQVALMAVLAAIFQIIVLVDAGLITGFGKSPLSFTPQFLIINSILVLSTLLGTELSRAYLTKNLGRKRPVLTLGLVTLLYTFINTSVIGLITLFNPNNPLPLADYLGSKFLPIVTENLLATYLAFLGGPMASLAYRGPLQAFQWFCPILPNLTWGFEALIGVMTPTISLFIVNQAVNPKLLKKIGLLTQTETKGFRRLTKTKKTSQTGWVVIAIFLVLTVWFSTGLIGPRLTVALSGSMTPTVDIGDIALVLQTPTEKINIGDIIQYWQEETMNLHRVIEIQQTEGGARLFITKGDANNAPDPDPIRPEQIKGKVVYVIPKLGWATITINTAIRTLISLLTTNPTITLSILTAAVATTTATTFLKHRKQRKHHFLRHTKQHREKHPRSHLQW